MGVSIVQLYLDVHRVRARVIQNQSRTPVALAIGAVVTLLLSTTVGARNKQTVHRFRDFQISTVYRGKVRLPDFHGRDRDLSTFRTRIIDSMREGANFAGKYRVVTIGCGNPKLRAKLPL